MPEARWGWGPVALRFAPWLYVDSVQFLDSVHSESDLLRRGGGEAPDDKTRLERRRPKAVAALADGTAHEEIFERLAAGGDLDDPRPRFEGSREDFGDFVVPFDLDDHVAAGFLHGEPVRGESLA